MYNAKTIHVVTHSGIMRNYLKSVGIVIKSKKAINDFKTIGETNCWTFVTNSDVICLNNVKGSSKQIIIGNMYNQIMLLLNKETFEEDINEEVITNEFEKVIKNIENIDNKFSKILKLIIFEKYSLKSNNLFKNKVFIKLKPFIKLFLLIISLEKGVTENGKAKDIENKFKIKNKSLCGTSGKVKSTRKTYIECSKGMEGGKKTRRRRKIN